MTDATAAVLLEPARETTILGRVRGIEPYELLIFFILAALLALCLLVAQTVVVSEDVGKPSARPGAPL